MEKLPKRHRSPNTQPRPRKRPDNRWEMRYTDPNGKQKSIYASTQGEVLEKFRKVQTSIDTGNYIEESNLTVSEWLSEWLSEFKSNTAKESTVTLYRRNLERYIIPEIGSMRISKLTGRMVQLFVNALTKKHRLSPNTVISVYSTLSGGMNKAARLHMISNNPCERGTIELPRVEKSNARAADREELGILFEYLKDQDDPYYDFYLVAVLTGMRECELIGLCWEDIDFRKHRISVRRQIHRQNGDGISISTPKNGESRTVPFDDMLSTVLSGIRNRQKQARECAGLCWKQYEELEKAHLHPVFTWETGMLYAESSVRSHLHEATTALRLPSLKVHDLRHTFATHALETGWDVKAVSDALGHKSTAFTMDKYGHVTEQAREENAAKLSAALRPVVGLDFILSDKP